MAPIFPKRHRHANRHPHLRTHLHLYFHLLSQQILDVRRIRPLHLQILLLRLAHPSHPTFGRNFTPGQKGECEFYVGGGPEDGEGRESGCVPLLSQASILYYLGHTFIRATQPLFFILAIVSTHWIKEADFSILSICLPVGFEGLTTDSSHNTLYALLQSATIQDGGDDDMTSRYTRLVAFDVSSSSTASSFTAANVTSSRSETATGTVTGEWVVPLPTSKKGKTRAASELHYVSEGVFLVLSRDGNGHGDDEDDASYKCVRHFTTHPICGRLTLARTTYPF